MDVAAASIQYYQILIKYPNCFERFQRRNFTILKQLCYYTNDNPVWLYQTFDVHFKIRLEFQVKYAKTILNTNTTFRVHQHLRTISFILNLDNLKINEKNSLI